MKHFKEILKDVEWDEVLFFTIAAAGGMWAVWALVALIYG